MSKGLTKWRKRLDEKWVGITFGVAAPVITFLVMWMVSLGDKSWSQMVFLINHSPKKSDILILPLISNMVLFYLSNFRLKWNRFSIGLVMASVVLAIFVVVLILF